MHLFAQLICNLDTKDMERGRIGVLHLHGFAPAVSGFVPLSIRGNGNRNKKGAGAARFRKRSFGIAKRYYRMDDSP